MDAPLEKFAPGQKQHLEQNLQVSLMLQPYLLGTVDMPLRVKHALLQSLRSALEPSSLVARWCYWLAS